MQLSSQLAAALDEQRLVDRLVAHPHRRIVRVLEAQPPGDLLGRPPLLEPRLDLGTQGARDELCGLRPACSLIGTMVRLHGPVMRGTAVRPHLARDRGRRAAEPACDRADRLAGGQPAADLLTVAEREPVFARRPRDLARLALARTVRDALHGPKRAADLHRDLADRLAFPPERSGALALLERQVRCQGNLPVESAHGC